MRFLFFIVGVGAGNARRSAAIIRRLREQAPGADIHVAAQGRALELLDGLAEMHPMQTLDYGEPQQRMDPIKILRANLKLPWRYWANRRRAAELMYQLHPAVVVADSDFVCLSPAKKQGRKLVTINNSPVVVDQLKRWGVPAGCGFSARIERADGWLQRRYATHILAPVFDPAEVQSLGLDGKIVPISPVVPEPFEHEEPEEAVAEEPAEIVVITGGSGIGVEAMDLSGISASIQVFGTAPSRLPQHAVAAGFRPSGEVAAAAKRAKLVVMQGGFTSLSEAMALHRPTLIVPIPGHAEQAMNAQSLAEKGWASVSDSAGVGEKTEAMLSAAEELPQAPKSFTCNGATEAAENLINWAST